MIATGSNPAMPPVVSDLLPTVDRLMIAALSGRDTAVSAINTHLLHGTGKRLRASLVLIAGSYGDADRTPSVLAAAAAVELIHLGSLIHDDVIDDANVRRGRPAVHRRWNAPVAGFSGAYAFACASSLIASLGSDRVRRAFAETVRTVCQGQLMEIENCRNPALTEERYRATIERKTAVLFEFAALSGAVVAGATPAVVDALSAYGRAFGMLFQVVDDMLDVVGEPGLATKPTGTDLRRGLYTLPVLAALRADPTAELGALLGRSSLDGAELEHALDLVRRYGVGSARAEAHRLGEHASAALAELPPGPATAVLRDLMPTYVRRFAPAIRAVR